MRGTASVSIRPGRLSTRRAPRASMGPQRPSRRPRRAQRRLRSRMSTCSESPTSMPPLPSSCRRASRPRDRRSRFRLWRCRPRRRFPNRSPSAEALVPFEAPVVFGEVEAAPVASPFGEPSPMPPALSSSDAPVGSRSRRRHARPGRGRGAGDRGRFPCFAVHASRRRRPRGGAPRKRAPAAPPRTSPRRPPRPLRRPWRRPPLPRRGADAPVDPEDQGWTQDEGGGGRWIASEVGTGTTSGPHEAGVDLIRVARAGAPCLRARTHRHPVGVADPGFAKQPTIPAHSRSRGRWRGTCSRSSKQGSQHETTPSPCLTADRSRPLGRHRRTGWLQRSSDDQ